VNPVKLCVRSVDRSIERGLSKSPVLYGGPVSVLDIGLPNILLYSQCISRTGPAMSREVTGIPGYRENWASPLTSIHVMLSSIIAPEKQLLNNKIYIQEPW
jgi:hypothetical protein